MQIAAGCKACIPKANAGTSGSEKMCDHGQNDGTFGARYGWLVVSNE